MGGGLKPQWEKCRWGEVTSPVNCGSGNPAPTEKTIIFRNTHVPFFDESEMEAHFPKRKNIRLKEWDYSRPDAYFVTMCVKNRECLFGDVVDGKMILNATGARVEKMWCELPNHYTNIEIDTHVVMPNHFHGIVHIEGPVGRGNPAPTKDHIGTYCWVF